MQIEIIFLLVENAGKFLCDITGDIFDRGISYQVKVQFGPKLGQQSSEKRPTLRIECIFVLGFIDFGQVTLQNFQMVLRAQWKPIANYRRLNIIVKQNRYQRILETRHDDNIVDKLIFRAAHTTQTVANMANIFL